MTFRFSEAIDVQNIMKSILNAKNSKSVTLTSKSLKGGLDRSACTEQKFGPVSCINPSIN